ncbi:MAG: endonuclease [Bacteroidales bacterium]
MSKFNALLLGISLIFVFSSATAQTINVSQTSIDFEQVYPDYHSRVQTYTVSASNLNNDLTITSPQGFLISTDCFSGYAASINLSAAGGNISNQKIYVKFYPQSSGTFSGAIMHESAGASTKTISLNETTGSSSLPQNYYSPATSTGAALKTELFNIIKGHNVQSYNALWSHYQSTDKKPNGKVWDMYTDNGGCETNAVEFTFSSDQCGNYGAEGDCYNREHSFPKSWFNDGSPMNTDLYHVVPTDGYNNGMRANYPYGEVSSAGYLTDNGSKRGNNNLGNTYNGLVFEPADIYKGDFARIYFYMATRYENQIAGWESNSSYADVVLDGTAFPVFEQWQLDMLVDWHEQDPVSQKEIERNDEIYAIQGNRNPFVDNPQYVYKIWGNEISVKPEPDSLPSNFEATALSDDEINITWNDAAGTIQPDGYLIQANLDGNFTAPVDGNQDNMDADLSDGEANVYVNQGAESYMFSNLDAETVYHFKIWAYANSASNIDYKTNPAPPQDTAKTHDKNTAAFSKEHLNIFDAPLIKDGKIWINKHTKQSIRIKLYSYTGQKLKQHEVSGSGIAKVDLPVNTTTQLVLITVSAESGRWTFKRLTNSK